MRKIDWRSCHSMSEDHELEKLESWCQWKSDELGREIRMLEIGSFHGKTTAIMAQFGVVLACDLWGNVEDGVKHTELIGKGTFEPFISNMVRLALIGRVIPIVSTSSFLEFFKPVEFDLAFVDGGHYFHQVNIDLHHVEPHMSDNSLIVLHDYKRPGWGYPPFNHNAKRDPWEGVAQAVDKFLAERPWEVHEHYAGIIALRRRK